MTHQAVVRGRPWKPGQTGNPLGGAVIAKRITELFDSMRTDFADLSAVEVALLWQAARLMWRSERCKDGNTAVRLTNSASRLLTNLRNTKRPEPVHIPLRVQLQLEADAEAAEREDA